MSAQRISVKGEPTRHIDLGPAVGRRSFTRGMVYGGVLVVSGHGKVPTRRRHGMPCDQSTCGRLAGHMGRHQTAARLAELSARRSW